MLHFSPTGGDRLSHNVNFPSQFCIEKVATAFQSLIYTLTPIIVLKNVAAAAAVVAIGGREGGGGKGRLGGGGGGGGGVTVAE